MPGASHSARGLPLPLSDDDLHSGRRPEGPAPEGACGPCRRLASVGPACGSREVRHGATVLDLRPTDCTQ